MPRYKSKRRGKQTGEDLSHWATDAVRPNVHLGIHYPDFAEEYALPSNVHTLVGEDLHRYVLTALLMRDVRIVECQALGCQGINNRKRDRVTNNKATILKSRTTNLVLILCVQIL